MRILATIAAFIALAAVPAHAAPPLITPMIPADLDGVTVGVCNVVPTGSKPVEITIEIIDADFNIPSATSGVITANPGIGVSIFTGAVPGNAYCKVTGLSAKTGRATYGHYAVSQPVMVVTAP